ncbi:MAG: hypothetical protein L6R38_007919 [Xanthoria sp. 2 TBL-2021]|nr:MAG: hypothetical protein L6R38_007919 [Xanthoria sp. 2 TBL-2021]
MDGDGTQPNGATRDRQSDQEQYGSPVDGDNLQRNGATLNHQNDGEQHDSPMHGDSSQPNGAMVNSQNDIEQNNNPLHNSEQSEESSDYSLGSDNHSEENNDNDDDRYSDSTERPVIDNQAVLVNDGYLMPPHVVRGTGYIVWQFAHGGVPLATPPDASSWIELLAVAETQERANRFLNDTVRRNPHWRVVDNSPDSNGNAQCTLVRRSDHRGSMMMQLKVAEIHLIS